MTSFRSGLFCAAAVVGLTGCTSGFDKVRDTVSAAPDWYDARAVEVRGEGYPNVAEIPVLTPEQRTDRNLSAGLEDLQAADRLFAMNPRAIPPGLELDDMMVWAEAARRDADQFADETFEHFTEEELARLRALFNIPRARTS
ncbi:MAG: hypothetical protein AAF216_10660 [Pseudomonadota bacterium]